MTDAVSEKAQAKLTGAGTEAKAPQTPRGSGKWVTAFILVLIAAFFFGSVIINRIAMTQA